jgi:putative YphP/YqiW family bacilliredoxin
MYDLIAEQMRKEVTRHGVKELRTVAEVETLFASAPGTMLIFVNSNCGCAGGVARPALAAAVQHEKRAEVVATVFASTDREATAAARSHFTGMPPSSPSFAFFQDGKLVEMIHRSDIEISSPQVIAARIESMFEKYCAPVSQG